MKKKPLRCSTFLGVASGGCTGFPDRERVGVAEDDEDFLRHLFFLARMKDRLFVISDVFGLLNCLVMDSAS